MASVVRKSRSSEAPQTIQEWMERTGTNGRQLLKMLRERGCTMSEGHLSNLLKKSRRCSLVKAVVLHEITGVPIRNMIEWPPVRDTRTSQSAA